MDKVIEKIAQWHKDRNLIEGATSKDQVLKLIDLSNNLQIKKQINILKIISIKALRSMQNHYNAL